MSCGRNKGSSAMGFLPDERCLGGASLTSETWRNHFRRIVGAKPSIDNHRGVVTADTLSLNRLRKRTNMDTTAHKHINNVYHMHRRMDDLYTLTERKKNCWDPDLYPVFQKRSRKSHLITDMCPWLPETQHRLAELSRSRSPQLQRPTTAPAPSDRSPDGPGHSSWRQGELQAAAVRSDQGGLDDAARMRMEARLQQQFEDEIMLDIVEGRVYEEKRLKQLLRRWLRNCPRQYRPLLRGVVAKLASEMGVA